MGLIAYEAVVEADEDFIADDINKVGLGVDGAGELQVGSFVLFC